MYASNMKLVLGLLYAVTIVLCTPLPSPNPASSSLNSQPEDVTPFPILNAFGRLSKRSKAGDAVQKIRAVVDTGNTGGPKLVADLQKLMKDLEGIITQLKGAGLIPGDKKDQKAQDLKQADALSAAAPNTEAKLAEADPATKLADPAPKLPEITVPSPAVAGATVAVPAAPGSEKPEEE
ncbi:hypothetical protein PTTG_00056 [Puccinia triticina 1-1 BBBD Race 1]|uniref:Uncharacterized protein n=1 Tax=Puccinia triticina (isolate 1-1 / race 1 (BBBD)) TaxID=630390 RepID=A0A0C4EH40_PUCT1|nr:hypothetical protein PTTG_00056 [Puccinia triticina 1-1 BBBD Race 1]WAR55561.1 hypothetical protein PtB15_6B302 [Puccinia triticina]